MLISIVLLMYGELVYIHVLAHSWRRWRQLKPEWCGDNLQHVFRTTLPSFLRPLAVRTPVKGWGGRTYDTFTAGG